MLTRKREQVALVIILVMAVREHEIEAVAVRAVHLGGYAARHGAALAAGIVLHPAEAVPFPVLGHPDGVRDESGGKHFGKDDEVRL